MKKRKGPLRGKFTPQNPQKYKGNVNNIIYRSSWELKLMLALDKNINVLQWSSEEFFIPYYSEIDKKMHKYYPDFLVTVKNKNNRKNRILIEVKPHHQSVLKPKSSFSSEMAYTKAFLIYKRNMEKWEAAREWAAQNNTKFIVMTEKNTNFI